MKHHCHIQEGSMIMESHHDLQYLFVWHFSNLPWKKNVIIEPLRALPKFPLQNYLQEGSMTWNLAMTSKMLSSIFPNLFKKISMIMKPLHALQNRPMLPPTGTSKKVPWSCNMENDFKNSCMLPPSSTSNKVPWSWNLSVPSKTTPCCYQEMHTETSSLIITPLNDSRQHFPALPSS